MSINPLDAAEKAMAFADDSFESREEAAVMRTRRQEIDLKSPYKLPHLIRPIMAIWSMLTYSFAEAYGLYTGQISGLEAMAANAAIVMAIIGFYFNSRKAEKTVAKTMSGQLEIVAMKAKTAIKLEEIKAKATAKSIRKSDRIKRKKDRKDLKDSLQSG